jgi:two-component system, OmpR family, sensor histidine kinase CiaH
MFKRTRRRLVILNALVFFILQNLFGALIYVYTRYNLFHQVDQTILEKENHLIHEKDEKLGNQLSPEREENHRLVFLLWGEKGQLNQIIPKGAVTTSEAAHFSNIRNTGGVQSTTIGAESYRFLNISVSKYKKYTPVKNIQIIYNLKHENEMLYYLLIIISFGSLLSVFIAIIAGIYLANKALIPIKLSWEKQQQFVGDASHELRTPLSVMKLNLEYLFRHPEKNIEQASETILQVIQEINYMTKMTSDLLTLARSDSNQLEILKEVIELDDILCQVAMDFKSLASIKNIKLTTEISTIKMEGDKERLKQLFVILIDNAVKYTKENGSILIKSSIKNSRATIDISDTGIGISKEDLPYIFDRYYRGDKSRTRHLEGSGLGLSIAKWIVQSHEGKIRVMSKEGEGTRVFLSFPLRLKK